MVATMMLTQHLLIKVCETRDQTIYGLLDPLSSNINLFSHEVSNVYRKFGSTHLPVPHISADGPTWEACSIWLKGAVGVVIGAMAELPFKSTASWKTWWTGTTMAKELAESMFKLMDPTKIAGEGRLVKLDVAGKPGQSDFKDDLKAKLTEALLLSYPPDKDASGYLLADAVLLLDQMFQHAVLGKPSPNPMLEHDRRERALKDGANLKLLLSHIRNTSQRHEKGRVPQVTYLKELAASKFRPKRIGRSGSQPKMSPTSPTTSVATTIGLDGHPLHADTPSSSSDLENAVNSPNLVIVYSRLFQ